MSAAHTPGPWYLQMIDNNTGRIQHLCPMDEDGLSLLTVVKHDGKKFAAVYKDEDARLIAAAPDLLEALKAVVANSNGDASSGYFDIPVSTVQNAIEAIAKAVQS